MRSTAIKMFQHILSITSGITIDKLHNFMQFFIVIDVLLSIFNDMLSINEAIFVTLFNLASHSNISTRIFTKNNISNTYEKDDDKEFVDQVGESLIIDNRSRFRNSSEQLIILFFITCEAAVHANKYNLNKNYCDFDNGRLLILANYYTAIYVQNFFPADTNTIADSNTMVTMWDQLLTDAKKTEVMFTDPLIISESSGNHVTSTIQEYNEQKFHLYNAALINFYYGDKIRDRFKTTTSESSFEYHNITSVGREARIEYLTNTDVLFNTLFGNTANMFLKMK